MNIRERVGIDIDDHLSLTESIHWADTNDVSYIDVNIERDLARGFSDAKITEIREAAANADISFGLHTLSAVNMAETSPFVDEASDEYLRTYVDRAVELGADWVVVHGGYHFSSDVDERFEAAVARLQRGIQRAAESGVTLLLENHNPEPDSAEVHYIPTTPEECNRFFEEFPEEELGWAFNPPHANLHPDGISGFLDAMNLHRCGEVRLNDNRGTHEEHLPLGEGNIDFGRLFERLEGAGYDGHYMLAYGDLEDRLSGRDYLLDRLES